jgi:hypothetical protein
MLSRHGQAGYGTVRYFAPAPAQGVSADLPPWEMTGVGWDYSPPAASGEIPLSGLPTAPPPVIDDGVVIPGDNTPPTNTFYEDENGDIITAPFTFDTERYWVLELRTGGGTLVDTVDNHWQGRVTFNADVAPEMEFSTDAEFFDDFAAVGTREIWLRDWRRALMGRFEILDVERVFRGDGRYYRVRAQGLVARLSRATVGRYSTPVTVTVGEGGKETRTRRYASVSAIVAGLLALQTRTPLFTVGTIDPAIATTQRIFAVEETNVMDALRQLQATMPRDRAGHMWIDGQGRLQWRQKIGAARQTLSSSFPAPAITSATVRMRLDEIITRVYYYGAPVDGDRFLALSDAGQPADYIQQNTGTYGIRALRKIDNRIKYPETLLSTARRVLEEYSTPYYEVEIDAVDLVKADGTWPTVDIWPGTEYLIDDATASPMGAAYVMAQAVTYDLTNPLAVGVKLANRAKRLSDIIERLVSQQNPATEEEERLDAWEDSDRYGGHFARMLGRSLADANEYPDSPTGRDIDAAIRDFLDRYVPPFQTQGGSNYRTIPEVFENHETRIQAIEDGGGGADPGDDILPIVSTPDSPGESEKFAREDHQHQGAPGLESTSEPSPTGSRPMLWFNVDNEGTPQSTHTLERGASGSPEYRQLVPCLSGQTLPASAPEGQCLFFQHDAYNRPVRLFMAFYDAGGLAPGMRWLCLSHFVPYEDGES